MANNQNNNQSSRGVGFGGLLTLLFITLKLTGYITWSWWWVLSPIWITLIVVIVILVICGVVAIILKN
jgi:hypothetical protein